LPSLTLLENQGFSNTNYLLKTDKKNYIIRVNGSLHVDRKQEFNILYEAYQKDIGAKPIYYDNSFMIYEFLDGSHKYLLKPKDIKKISQLLKKLHQIKIGNRLFNKKKDFVLCHHDLNPKNFIFSDNIKLIDWEYARKNDRYFDLATIAVEFKLNKKEEKLLLKSYFQSRHYKNKMKSFKINYLKTCIRWFRKNQKIKIKYQKKMGRIKKVH